MGVAEDSRSDLAGGSTSQLALGLPGQKKRTSSGSVRRWPILRTRSSSERPDMRSDEGNLVLFIRDRQALAALGTAAGEHPAPVLGRHPLTKPMTVGAAAAGGLISSFHDSIYGDVIIICTFVGEPAK